MRAEGGAPELFVSSCLVPRSLSPLVPSPSVPVLIQSAAAGAPRPLPVFVVALELLALLHRIVAVLAVLPAAALLRGESVFGVAAQFAVGHHAFEQELGRGHNFGSGIGSLHAQRRELFNQALNLLELLHRISRGLVVFKL